MDMINFIYVTRLFECGHFCINYILKKDKIKNNLDYHRQFMSLGLVKRVLNFYYSRVDCYKVCHFSNLINMHRFITLIKFKKNKYHYVVVERIESNKVYYYDPLIC